MARKSARKLYAKPIVQRRGRLADITEGNIIVVTGGPSPKGGCFSKNR